mmetsp:Transcript_46917/g.118220  ORF Transcript_46917/g.118220 Transcript_46917/m.118220 type:complete len:81 (+) Transcript_46917:231-473(+)
MVRRGAAEALPLVHACMAGRVRRETAGTLSVSALAINRLVARPFCTSDVKLHLSEVPFGSCDARLHMHSKEQIPSFATML